MLSDAHFPIKLTRKLLLKNRLIACLSLQFVLAVCKKNNALHRLSKCKSLPGSFFSSSSKIFVLLCTRPLQQPMLALLSCPQWRCRWPRSEAQLRPSSYLQLCNTSPNTNTLPSKPFTVDIQSTFFLNISAGRVLLPLEQISNTILTLYISATSSVSRCLGEGTKFGRDLHVETRMDLQVISDKATVCG